VVLAPVAPALAQALFHANGVRVTGMPFPEKAFALTAAGDRKHQRKN
jgi:CO/xanthine dehydrogenase Mo-binding subunit